MPNIVHRIEIENSTTQATYDAVATNKGLASWWTVKVLGKSEVGGILQFRFGAEAPDFKVLELKAPLPGLKEYLECGEGRPFELGFSPISRFMT